MKLEFPYQIVTFLNREPRLNEPVYYGENGWFAQLALKRRFRLNGISESQLIQLLAPLFSNGIHLKTGSLIQPEHLPVRVITIENQSQIKTLHLQLITLLNGDVASRYPDREGDHYYAHITAEYGNAFVIPVDEYINKEFNLSNVWLLKDGDDENSRAYIKIA